MSSERSGVLPPRDRHVASASADRTPGYGVRGASRVALRFGTYLLNPLIVKLGGSPYLPLFAVIRHRGRRSGRAYATPVGARRTPNGFVIPLTFGEQADWFRNVRAAGECVIHWKGADYPVVNPEIIDWATAQSAFHPVERALVPLLGIEQFARLRSIPASEKPAEA